MRPYHAFLCLVAVGFAALVAFPPTTAGTSAFDVLLDGLARRSIEHQGEGGAFTLEVLRVDPRKLRLRMLDARKLGHEAMTAREFCAETGALAAVNGGFFLKDLTPLGLLVCDGKEVNPLRKVDWGVFSLASGRARIVHTRDYVTTEPVDQAIQSGPRLVVGGAPVKLKPQTARRTALGIDAEGLVYVMATREGIALADDLATLLSLPASKGGLGLTDALNLDGGPSTQLYARVGEVVIEIPGLSSVPTAVGVFRAAD